MGPSAGPRARRQAPPRVSPSPGDGANGAASRARPSAGLAPPGREQQRLRWTLGPGGRRGVTEPEFDGGMGRPPGYRHPRSCWSRQVPEDTNPGGTILQKHNIQWSAQAPPGHLLAVAFSPTGPVTLCPACPPAGSGAPWDFPPSGAPPTLPQASSGDCRAQPASPAQSHRHGGWSLVAGAACTAPAAPVSCDLAPGRPAGSGALSSSPWTGRHGRGADVETPNTSSEVHAPRGRPQPPRGLPVSADPSSAAVGSCPAATQHCSWASLSCPSEPSERPCSADSAVPGATGVASVGGGLSPAWPVGSKPPSQSDAQAAQGPAGSGLTASPDHGHHPVCSAPSPAALCSLGNSGVLHTQKQAQKPKPVHASCPASRPTTPPHTHKALAKPATSPTSSVAERKPVLGRRAQDSREAPAQRGCFSKAPQPRHSHSHADPKPEGDTARARFQSMRQEGCGPHTGCAQDPRQAGGIAVPPSPNGNSSFSQGRWRASWSAQNHRRRPREDTAQAGRAGSAEQPQTGLPAERTAQNETRGAHPPPRQPASRKDRQQQPRSSRKGGRREAGAHLSPSGQAAWFQTAGKSGGPALEGCGARARKGQPCAHAGSAAPLPWQVRLQTDPRGRRCGLQPPAPPRNTAPLSSPLNLTANRGLLGALLRAPRSPPGPWEPRSAPGCGASSGSGTSSPSLMARRTTATLCLPGGHAGYPALEAGRGAVAPEAESREARNPPHGLYTCPAGADAVSRSLDVPGAETTLCTMREAGRSLWDTCSGNPLQGVSRGR
ncbi:collagen alpha-1(I) chain-like [Meles meles]|uniref:collagen alpha-1(I) chain-like n=1 Tax=Meles meles TaxID=9662 RepID=UPI001E69D7E6|nr:collagen alpha-1(I) chain-like [Meles meles]